MLLTQAGVDVINAGGTLDAIDLKVTQDTPPMFFVMAQDDRVNSLNCTALYIALTKAQVPAEMHLFAHGGHGYGLRSTAEPITAWPKLAAEWLKQYATP